MFTPRTQLIRQIIFKINGSISFLGSGYIIQDVLRNPHKRSRSIYHRIMVGLSATDILFSLFTHVLSSWVMPKGSFVWAVGSVASCDIAGFLGRIGAVGSPLYNCSLATYFSLQIKYKLSDARMEKAEKWFHIVPWSISLLFNIIVLCAKSCGPSPGFCGYSVMNYPLGCNKPGSEVECIRCRNMLPPTITNILFVICIIYVLIATFLLVKSVRQTEVNALRYSFTARVRGIDKKKHFKRSRRIMIQGILYSIAMAIVWSPVLINVINLNITKKPNPVVAYFVCTLNPLQGGFNFCIYMMPAFRKILKTFRQKKMSCTLDQGLSSQKDQEDDGEENVVTPPHKIVRMSPALSKLYASSEGNSAGNRDLSENDSLALSIEEEKEEIQSLDPTFSR